jgi:lipoyl(octanoyl) transferase
VSARIEVHRHTAALPWTYSDLERRQTEVRDAVRAGRAGRLIFSEVAPVVTLGIRRTEEDLLADRAEFARRGIALLEVTRGGRASYHGPGQWVVFPVESLDRLTGDRRGVRKAVTGLLEAVAEACADRFPRAEIRDGKEAGVWTEPGRGGGKFAAIGIRVMDGVVQHGISVNVFSTPESFAGIRPCGLEAPVAFLSERTGSEGGEAAFLERRSGLERAFLDRFPIFRDEMHGMKG